MQKQIGDAGFFRRSWGFYLFVILVASAASLFLADMVGNGAEASLLNRINTISISIPDDTVENLEGSESDLENPTYLKLKTYLTQVRSVNSDTRFIYLVGKNEQKDIFFYADSEDPASPDYSPPGQVYYEASPKLHSVFETGEGVVEGPTSDRWGTWISGYAPLKNDNGEVIAVAGLDIPAAAFMVDSVLYSSLPFLISAIIILLILYVSRKMAL